MVTYLSRAVDIGITIGNSPIPPDIQVLTDSVGLDFTPYICTDNDGDKYANYIIEFTYGYADTSIVDQFGYAYIGELTSIPGPEINSILLYKDHLITNAGSNYRAEVSVVGTPATIESFKIYAIHDYFAKTVMVSDAEAYKGRVLRPVLMCSFDFLNASDAADPLYINNSLHDFTYDSVSWLGTSGLVDISATEESTELQSYDLKVTLSGVDATNISKAFNYTYRDRDFVCYLALFDSNYQLDESSVTTIFRGKMDNMEIIQHKVGSVTITIQNSFVDWERINGVYYSLESQKLNYPTDTGFSFLQQMIDKDLTWERS